MKNSQKAYCLLLLLIMIVTVLEGWAQQSSDSLFREKVHTSFQHIVDFRQEKVYLHVDKPYYFVGDTIWLKTYLVDAITHIQNQGSRYVYAELINRKDLVVRRLKIPMHNQKFLGFIAIPSNLQEGEYYLRAYTHWMLNSSTDYFFSKNIQILASQSPGLLTDIWYQQKKEKRSAIITFRKPGGGVFAGHYVHYMVRTKKATNEFRQQQTNKQGEIQVDIPNKEQLEQYIYVILEEGPLKYKRTIYVPNQFDYHVDFFPEGGRLITGVTQKIAFKALGTDGHSLPIEGIILNNKGDTVTHFQSMHHGIGSFMLNAVKSEMYKAVVTAKEMQEQKVFDIPKHEADKFSLSVSTRKEVIHYQILHSPETPMRKSFYLLGHIRGFVLFIKRVEQESGVIDFTSIPEGILSLVLLDSSYMPHSERLVFIRHDNTNCHVNQDKTSYPSRTPVSLDIQLTDITDAPLQGDFSLSVTDNYAVGIDTTAGNILSHILLTSDLKGYIESPGYYFRNNSPQTKACLDNLILTHGWSRFNVENTLNGILNPYQYFVEVGQSVSGKVNIIYNKPISGKEVHVKIEGKVYPAVTTDSKGAFVLDKLSFVDTTKVEAFVLETGKVFRTDVRVDPDYFPESNNTHPYNVAAYKLQNEYIEEIQSPYVKEDGILMLRLPEVVINSKSLVKDRFSSYKVDDEEMLKQQDARTAQELVRTVPGFQVINNRPYLNPKYSQRPDMLMSTDTNNRKALRPNNQMNYGRTVHFMLDNKSISYELLSSIEAKDIASIHKIEPEVDAAVNFVQNMKTLENAYNEALENGATLEELDQLEIDQQIKKVVDGDQRISGGCIVLTSRTGNLQFPRHDSRSDQAYLLGVNKYKTFYAPLYASPQSDVAMPDKRTTIHWEPDLLLDREGKAHVIFYTADRPGFYTVIIEGVTDKGIPCHYEYLLKR